MRWLWTTLIAFSRQKRNEAGVFAFGKERLWWFKFVMVLAISYGWNIQKDSFGSVRSSRSQMFFKICHLKISHILHENTCVAVSLQSSGRPSQGLQLEYKETPTQEFSNDICEIIKNTFFTEYLQWLHLQLTYKLKICFTKVTGKHLRWRLFCK